MGGACSAYGGEERRIQGFGGGNGTERDHLVDLGIYGRIILKMDLQKVGSVGMDWIDLAQDKYR